jgi:hypothetical protein
MMSSISDGAVDAAYRRGLGDLVARAQHPAPVRTHSPVRRAPIVVAIIGLGIPLAALAAMAFIVITGHTHASEVTPPVATTSASAIGHTTHILDSRGVHIDVTVEKVTYATSGVGADALPPRSGHYAVVDVVISLKAAFGVSTDAEEFTSGYARLNALAAQLQAAVNAHDTALVAALRTEVDQQLRQLVPLAGSFLPVSFVYRANDGSTTAAFSGNALVSGYAPMFLTPEGVSSGVTYGNVVFDVPSTGGVIQMTDRFSNVVGTWRLPAASSTPEIEHASVGQTIHVADSQGRLADVSIQSVTYATSGSGVLSQSPDHRYFVIANVVVSTTAGVTPTVAEDGDLDSSLQARVNQLAAELHLAKSLGDANLVPVLTDQIAAVEQEFGEQEQSLPLAFTYEASDGNTYDAYAGNALTSGRISQTIFGPSGLALVPGSTSGQIVFDVPSKGGVIRMTDPLSNVVEEWTLPSS